jgi:glycosyltransferase involved in cell wall biosynthesis
MRGAERTFAAMAECWPGAPIHTLLYDEHGTHGAFAGRDVRPSYLQRAGVSQSTFRRLLPLFPRAAEHLDVSRHQVVISSSSAFAHGVRPGEHAVHVCYCHSPFRYAWHERERALEEVGRPLRPLVAAALGRIRRWDLGASQRVTQYVANSKITKRRIEEFYGRDALIVHPPVDVERFRIGQPEDYLVVVSELVAHKRVDLALEAARLARRRVKVVGTGPDLEQLRARHGDHAEFLGRVPDDRLVELYSRASAGLVCNVEEFGIAAVEVMASGRPVVALDAGGPQETVIDGATGVLVGDQTPEAFAEAIGQTDFARFDPERIRRHAVESFAREVFQERLRRVVGEAAVRP